MSDALRTPRELLEQRGQLSDDVVAARVGGRLVDLHTPIAASAELEPVRVDQKEALDVIRHSAAHVMADAVQRLFPGTQVTIGPAIDTGFYYDFDRPEGPFTDKDLERIEKDMRRSIRAGRPFVAEAVTRAEAARLFGGMREQYALQLLTSMPAGETSSHCRHGGPAKPGTPWLGLCERPHVPTTA